MAGFFTTQQPSVSDVEGNMTRSFRLRSMNGMKGS